MKFLITGGAGFIGSHLCERLLADGHSVVALDNLSTGTMDNLSAVKGKPQFRCIIGSVLDETLVEDLVESCDVVVHLAAAVGVQTIMDTPRQSLLSNVEGTAVVLHAASRSDKLILIASTSEVYGKSTEIPFRESADVLLGPTAKIRWSYAYAKAVDECLAIAYAHEGKARPIIVRFFNTTGPRQTGRYGMVVPSFVVSALKNEPILVHGDGNQTRSFGHVGDVVEAVTRLIRTPQAVGEVFNVGNDEEVSILALAQKVKEMAQSRSEIRLLPYDQAYGPGFEDMRRRVPDVSKLERVIGFRPRKSLEQIISDVILEKRAALKA